MKIRIAVPEDLSKKNLLHLKSFLERADIEGLDKIDIERKDIRPGQMGFGEVMNSLELIIHAAEKPLVELVGCLKKYVELYQTTIVFDTEDGKVEIKHGRSMKPDQLEAIIKAMVKKKTS
jgi:hypothetical protein